MKRMELSRSKVVAMILGVSCPPATWIATRREPKVKTMNVSVSVTIVSRMLRVPDALQPPTSGSQVIQLPIEYASRIIPT